MEDGRCSGKQLEVQDLNLQEDFRLRRGWTTAKGTFKGQAEGQE